MRVNEPVTQRRVAVWDGANILSTTDSRGRIRYINEDFVRISGYQPDELIGQPHNVIRHPDMPRVVFEHMWQRLQSGQPWMGVIKNRCKNGDHYWVHAYATPIRDDTGNITEIQSVRQQIGDEAVIERAERAYRRLRAAEPDKGPLPAGLIERRRPGGGVWLAGGALAALLGVALGALLPVGTGGQLSLGIAGIAALGAAGLQVLSQLRGAREQARALLDDPLSEAIYLGRRDDRASIQLALLHLASETQAIAKRLGDDARRLSAEAAEARQSMHAVRDEAQQQSDETRSVATAMEQMSATVQEVAQNASATADATERAGKQTERGRQTVEQSTAAVRSLVRDIENAAATIERVNGEAERIGKAATLIGKITKQTHLLALNASVESARAGEAGRSFTVVAEEVRKLAGQTAESTREIDGVIESLQSGSAEAVEAMRESRSRAEQTLAHADESSSSLQEIQAAVDEIRDMAGQIATATEQQGATSQEIARSVSSIEGVAERVTGESLRTDERLQAVTERIAGIEALTGRFVRRR
ncbi:methyl-accepting chemotaxis protein [Halorhodospira halophila]|uniref:methyl-accepting chemotaxis protein n=1 Tax=Halorhodospira halophila TaxID=1053 RepID=UPI0019128BCA|nr:PAS domain-containing methyl-accepting chemotaxis protein [Halorhodospira halophila]MBK5935323.1 hypothetical protein [Halorhodospira halophila]